MKIVRLVGEFFIPQTRCLMTSYSFIAHYFISSLEGPSIQRCQTFRETKSLTRIQERKINDKTTYEIHVIYVLMHGYPYSSSERIACRLSKCSRQAVLAGSHASSGSSSSLSLHSQKVLSLSKSNSIFQIKFKIKFKFQFYS